MLSAVRRECMALRAQEVEVVVSPCTELLKGTRVSAAMTFSEFERSPGPVLPCNGQFCILQVCGNYHSVHC